MKQLYAESYLTPSPAFSHLTEASPQIVIAASFSASMWLSSALAQVREIEEFGELVPGLGDIRVPSDTAKRARMLLSTIEAQNLPVPLVSPVSGGGMSITWTVGNKEVKVEFEPGGEAAFFRVEDDEVIDDGVVDVTSRSPVAGQLKWMLNRSI
jgi:hypothetical protein